MQQQFVFDETTLKFGPQEVNIIINALGELPYKISLPVIKTIERQLMANHGPKPAEPVDLGGGIPAEVLAAMAAGLFKPAP